MFNNLLMITVTTALLWVGYILYWSLQEDSCVLQCGEWDGQNQICRQYECRTR
jgi:hypothetical protein